MSQELRIISDAERLRKTLYFSVFDAIWNFRLSTLPSHQDEFWGVRLPKAEPLANLLTETEYPKASVELLDTIESLLHLPFDLLSMTTEIDICLRYKYSNLLENHIPSYFLQCAGSIMEWAIILDAKEIIELILRIDPNQSKKYAQVLHRVLRQNPTSVLENIDSSCLPQLVQRLYDLNPDAITTPVTTPYSNGNLSLHAAIGSSQPQRVIKFLIEKYPLALSTRNIHGRVPLNCFCVSQANTKKQNLELYRYLIEQYPEGLGNIYTSLDGLSRFHTQALFVLDNYGVTSQEINPFIKMTYELGIKHNIFGKDTVYGLFEKTNFTFIEVTQLTWIGFDEDDENGDLLDEHVNAWNDYFHVENFYDDTVTRTILELFLCRYRLLNEPNYIHGWDDAFEVFQAAMDTAILQPAIGRVQDDFLPHIIDKFNVDLTHIDYHGRTPLIVSMYHAAFDVKEEHNDDDNNDDSDHVHVDKKRRICMSDGSSILSDASIILSSGKSSYERRAPDQPLKIDVISMMIGNRGDASTVDNMDMDNNPAYQRADANTQRNPAMIKDGSGRLPLHIGAEIGLGWDNGLKTVLDAYSLGVEIADPVTGLYAFMLAAVGKELYDLNAVFGLFVKQPDVIEKI